MNASIENAGLKAFIHRNSNDSVTALPGCAIFDSTFGGNAVRVEYKSVPSIDPDSFGFEDMAVECFWFAGRSFELDDVSAGQIEKWQKAAFDHAVEQGKQESLSIAINNLE